MITSYEDAERYFGRKADKNRKIYNGMAENIFLSVPGAKAAETEEIRSDCWRKRIEGRKQNEEKNCICNRK